MDYFLVVVVGDMVKNGKFVFDMCDFDIIFLDFDVFLFFLVGM